MGEKPSGKIINSGWGSHHIHHQETRRPRRGKESYAETSAAYTSFDTLSKASSTGSFASLKSDTSYYQRSRSNASSLLRSNSSSSMTAGELISRSRTESLRTNTFNSSSSLATTEWPSRSAIMSEHSSSRRAVVGHNDVLPNRGLRPVAELLRMPYCRRSSSDYFDVKFKQPVQWPGDVSLPSAPVLKINCAAAFSASSTQAGFGCVIRTLEGHFLAAFSGKLTSCEDAIVAEISAIKQGLGLAAWMMLQEVEVMSDSLFVISELQKPSNSRFAVPYHPLLNEVKGMAASFRNCKFWHIQEEANSVAHQLAVYGFYLDTVQSWFYAAPSFLLPALEQDVCSGYT